jgi:ketosteroid isomerase-like protein
LSVVCALAAGEWASAGTCEDPGSALTPDETRNVKTACEQMAAAMAGWVDPKEGPARLTAIQAEDFHWWHPSGDPAIEIHKNRDDYIALTSEWQHQHFVMPGSEVRIFATTAQDNRVATEMISDIADKVRNEPYGHRYHQLFVFNKAGKVIEYHLYSDYGSFVRDQVRRGDRLAENLLWGMSSGGVMYFSTILSDNFRWSVERPDGTASNLDKAQAVQALRMLQNGADGKLDGGNYFSITAPYSDMTVEGSRVAVVAKARHIDPATGKATETPHHLVVTFDADDRVASVEEYAAQPLFAAR